jgi:hypothetical protein
MQSIANTLYSALQMLYFFWPTFLTPISFHLTGYLFATNDPLGICMCIFIIIINLVTTLIDYFHFSTSFINKDHLQKKYKFNFIYA